MAIICLWNKSKHKGKECPIHTGIFGALDDVKNVNPYPKSRTNCYSSTIAYELKKRGIKAIPYENYDGDVRYCFKNQHYDLVEEIPKEYLIEAFTNYMMELPNHARLNVIVRWKDKDFGHSFIVEREDDKVYFLDPQRNKEINENWVDLVDTAEIKICRIDNLELDESKLKEIVERQ